MYEAQCPKCGEVYMPHSLDKEDVVHWGCEIMPKTVREYHFEDATYTDHRIKTRLVGLGANLLAVVVVAGFMAWAWWMVWESLGS